MYWLEQNSGVPPCEESTVNEVCWLTVASVRPLPRAVTGAASLFIDSEWELYWRDEDLVMVSAVSLGPTSHHRRVQLTTTPGFCSHFQERSLTRHNCSYGTDPVTRIGHNFAPTRCWYVTSYVTLCLLICCKSFIAWILPELSKRYLLWATVGCKLYKVLVCFCSPVFCQKLELVIR